SVSGMKIPGSHWLTTANANTGVHPRKSSFILQYSQETIIHILFLKTHKGFSYLQDLHGCVRRVFFTAHRRGESLLCTASDMAIYLRALVPVLMKVVIFCGGLGTRLREETEFRPK